MSFSDKTRYTTHLPEPCFAEVEYLYADDDILIANKPAGLLSVPGRILKDSLLQRTQYLYPDACIVHRLDLDTSGLMVLSLSSIATSELNRLFRERLVTKHYLADVWGELAHSSGEIDLPLRADPDNRPRQLVDHDSGKPSLTKFERLTVNGNSTRVRLSPVTGRSHQLRLHLSAIGHPILGCDLYAHPAAFAAADRLRLHAFELEFAHPVTGEVMNFTSVSGWED